MNLTTTHRDVKRQKIMGIKVSSDELRWLHEVSHACGDNLSVFTRKALQSYIDRKAS